MRQESGSDDDGGGGGNIIIFPEINSEVMVDAS